MKAKIDYHDFESCYEMNQTMRSWMRDRSDFKVISVETVKLRTTEGESTVLRLWYSYLSEY